MARQLQQGQSYRNIPEFLASQVDSEMDLERDLEPKQSMFQSQRTANINDEEIFSLLTLDLKCMDTQFQTRTCLICENESFDDICQKCHTCTIDPSMIFSNQPNNHQLQVDQGYNPDYNQAPDILVHEVNQDPNKPIDNTPHPSPVDLLHVDQNGSPTVPDILIQFDQENQATDNPTLHGQIQVEQGFNQLPEVQQADQVSDQATDDQIKSDLENKGKKRKMDKSSNGGKHKVIKMSNFLQPGISYPGQPASETAQSLSFDLNNKLDDQKFKEEVIKSMDHTKVVMNGMNEKLDMLLGAVSKLSSPASHSPNLDLEPTSLLRTWPDSITKVIQPEFLEEASKEGTAKKMTTMLLLKEFGEEAMATHGYKPQKGTLPQLDPEKVNAIINAVSQTYPKCPSYERAAGRSLKVKIGSFVSESLSYQRRRIRQGRMKTGAESSSAHVNAAISVNPDPPTTQA